MNMPLYEGILSLTDKYPMHMPGHKRNPAFAPEGLLRLDITEVDGSDNMHHPDGIIAEAQRAMADFQGADRSRFLVNGGSGGVLTAILGTMREGDKLIVNRNAHKSIFNACVLSGAVPVYISPDISPEGIATGISPETLEEAFREHPDAKAVLVTSPTYEGFTSDIRALSEIAHGHNALLIVDETHGAHFPFSDAFPETAMKQGADISVQSWHKTLPCINQSAVINIREGRVNIERLREAYSMVQTTSPSYIMLGLMDRARALLTEDRTYFDTYVALLREIRQELTHLKGMRLVATDDIGKIVIATGKNYNGKTLAKTLLKEYNVQIELEDNNHIIAMTSVADTHEGLYALRDGLIAIDRSLPEYEPLRYDFKPRAPLCPAISPREAFYSSTLNVPIDKAVGRVAGQCVTPFPPDIPLILTGEVITSSAVEELKAYLAGGHVVIGADGGTISIIQENSNGN